MVSYYVLSHFTKIPFEFSTADYLPTLETDDSLSDRINHNVEKITSLPSLMLPRVYNRILYTLDAPYVSFCGVIYQ